LRSNQDSRQKQRLNIGMYRLYVPRDPARRLTNGHRPGTAKRLQEFPTLGGQDFPEQFRSRKANASIPFRLSRLYGSRHIR